MARSMRQRCRSRACSSSSTTASTSRWPATPTACTWGSMISPGRHRRLVGRSMILGYSPQSLTEARAARESGADYVGLGPVFATGSKADAQLPLGLSGLAEQVTAARLPSVAIGGIESCDRRLGYPRWRRRGGGHQRHSKRRRSEAGRRIARACRQPSENRTLISSPYSPA